MSEDCDFKIKATMQGLLLNNSQRRNALRDFRHQIIKHLKENDFLILEENIVIRDVGNYIQINALYNSFYSTDEMLRPHIQLEFMTATPSLPTSHLPVTTLIKQAMGDMVDHAEKKINCIAITETAAEKWVGLTRRIANEIKSPDRISDRTLVRHIYDLYCISSQKKLDNQFYNLIYGLIREDSRRYKNQNIDYINDPMLEIKSALSMLSSNSTWTDNWNEFLNIMVYGDMKPDYQIALKTLNTLSENIFLSLPEIKDNLGKTQNHNTHSI